MKLNATKLLIQKFNMIKAIIPKNPEPRPSFCCNHVNKALHSQVNSSNNIENSNKKTIDQYYVPKRIKMFHSKSQMMYNKHCKVNTLDQNDSQNFIYSPDFDNYLNNENNNQSYNPQIRNTQNNSFIKEIDISQFSQGDTKHERKNVSSLTHITSTGTKKTYNNIRTGNKSFSISIPKVNYNMFETSEKTTEPAIDNSQIQTGDPIINQSHVDAKLPVKVVNRRITQNNFKKLRKNGSVVTEDDYFMNHNDKEHILKSEHQVNKFKQS